MTTARSAASEDSEAVGRQPPSPPSVAARRAVLRPRSRITIGTPGDGAPTRETAIAGPGDGAAQPEAATPPEIPMPQILPPPAPPPPAPPTRGPSPAGPTGPRHRRRLSRRRRTTEQVLIVVIFLVALGVTVLLLVSQWLLNASVTGAIRGTGLGVGLLVPTLPTSTAT